MAKKSYTYSQKDFIKGERILCRKFPDFASLVKKFPLSFIPHIERPPYLSLVRSIAYQQIQIKAAETILTRFYSLYHDKIPSPEDILATENSLLRAVGFSERKVKAIKDIAEKTLEGIVPSLEEVHELSDEEIIDRLIVIFGIGKWSVEMLLIWQLGRLDVWPIDDFGTRKGWQLWKKKKEMPTLEQIEKAGEKFRPYRSILALYLWQVSNANTQAKKK